MPWTTGSFSKLYIDGQDDYAEVAGYDPVELGYPIVKVVDGRIVNIEEKIFGDENKNVTPIAA